MWATPHARARAACATRHPSASLRAISTVLPAAVLAFCCTASPALAQFGNNITRDIRPQVHISFPGVAGSPPTVQGLFDTGNDNMHIAPETNALVGVAVSTNSLGSAWQRPFLYDSLISPQMQWTVGGWLGTTLNGPELQTPGTLPAGPTSPPTPPHSGQPAHAYTSVSTIAASSPVTRSNLASSQTYFNQSVSVNNVGTAFVGSDGTDAALVALVDPVNASATPYFLGSVDPNVGEPYNDINGNNTRDVVPLEPFLDINGSGGYTANGALNTAIAANRDRLTSNIAFLSATSVQTPTAAANQNMGFLRVLNIQPVPFGNTETFTSVANFARVQAGPSANPSASTTAPRVGFTFTNPNDPLLGGNPTGNYILDTGGTSTGGRIDNTTNGGPIVRLMGVDQLNGYTQYWDFANNQLLLFAPSRDTDQALLGPGMLMTVDSSSTGLAQTGVSQLRANGVAPVMTFGGNATTVTAATNQHGVGIFRTHASHTNASYIGGVNALGLQGSNNDQIDSMTLGGDRIPRPGGQAHEVFFSVDGTSVGFNGAGTGGFGGVTGQAILMQQEGDVFQSTTFAPGNTVIGTHQLRFNQDALGLGGNAGPSVSAAGRGNRDNLRDFDLDTIRGYTNQARIMRNFDPMITAPNDTTNTSPFAARTDVYGSTFDTYFSLQAGSASLGGVSSADVLVNNPSTASAGFAVFAPEIFSGLQPGDDIDAIVLDRAGSTLQSNPLQPGTQRTSSLSMITATYDANPLGAFDTIDVFHVGVNSADTMLFSLAPGSASLGIFDPFLNRNLSAADIFITDFDGIFALFASAESLGLLPTDNIDGIDAVPEPATWVLLLLGLGLLCCNRHRLTCRQMVSL